MKKGLKIAERIITIIILVFSIAMLIFTLTAVKTVGKDAAVFGYKPYIVKSNSMEGTFAAGDMTLCKSVDPETLEEGDIITFQSIDPNSYGEIFTHKIRKIITYEGSKAFVTYGTATDVNDIYPVPTENVLGEYKFCIPKMGYFVNYLRSPMGYFTIFLPPILLLTIIQAIKFIRLAKQYRQELKAQTEQDQKRTEELAKEVERLRAQVAQGSPAAQDEGSEQID